MLAVSYLRSLPTPGEGAQRGPPRPGSAAPLLGLGAGSGQHGLRHSQHDPSSIPGSQRPWGHLSMECSCR